ncbi:MAG: NAD(P)-binding domain-containing protein [Tannerella sp.]|jgi:glycerol-3-phosphate dehydrogenase (NAD(P)+)|nr:NAD(P)-binding domain-containing protein [Tannerella sp.]
MKNFPGKIAIMGGGSWATALAKIVMYSQNEVNWYMRRPDRIEDFKRLKHNPAYLSSVSFDISRINFYEDINKIIDDSDTLIFATPSPYLKEHLGKITVSLKKKYIISAIKGIVPDENMLINEYFIKNYGVHKKNILVVSGACHAEEIAMEHLSYQTIMCRDLKKAKIISETIFNTPYMKSACSKDITGLEYISVLKNVYAIVAGICNGLKFGDNFQAVFVPNALNEMMRFVQKVNPQKRNIASAAYLSDLLVTSYSSFSRNRVFGKMIGEGYTVGSAKVELGMIAEGYYAAKCIHEINERYKVDMPILNALYSILYEKMSPSSQIQRITDVLK